MGFTLGKKFTGEAYLKSMKDANKLIDKIKLIK